MYHESAGTRTHDGVHAPAVAASSAETSAPRFAGGPHRLLWRACWLEQSCAVVWGHAGLTHAAAYPFCSRVQQRRVY